MVYCNDSKNVIVLEDCSSIKDSLDEMIRQVGFTPFFAESRQEFLEEYIHQSFVSYSAMILDNCVPYDRRGQIINNIGITIAPQLLKREPELKIALHTGDDFNSRIPEFKKIGLVYLPKPVSMESLRGFLILK